MALTGLQRGRPYGYSKIQFEDREEAEHRRAQFLIYKIMEKADRMSSRKSWWRRSSVRVFKLKIKIGKRLKIRLRKGFSSSTLILAKPHLWKNIACLLKSCKYSLVAAAGKTEGQ